MIARQRKTWLWVVVALAALIIFTILAAPNSNKIMAGSTYSKEPSGYGAWYEYLVEQGYKVERWQKPFDRVIDNTEKLLPDNNLTYIQIQPSNIHLYSLPPQYAQWIEKGNQLVILGVKSKATEADFTSTQSYGNLQIQIKTTRRKQDLAEPVLQDEYGTIVWREKIGAGEIIYAVSPYISANAYQNIADNYQFLAQLIKDNHQLLIDEYIHGYKDVETKQAEKQGTLRDYFAKTVWFPLGFQTLAIAIVTIAFFWQRFGQVKRIQTQKTDNSQAYIEALAGVLEKAQATNFVAQTIGRDQQLKLQKKLGLGNRILAADILLQEWVKQTDKPADPLNSLLQTMQQQKAIKETELVKWMQKWQQIDRELE